MTAGIYAIKNTTTGRAYIGQTSNLRKRENRHWRDLSAGIHHCEYLQKSYNKHGDEAFEFLILEECEIGELTRIEQVWIDKTRDSDGVYNTAPAAGSVFGIKRTESHRSKIADALRGKKHTPERVAKMVKALTGRRLSDEHRAKLSVAGKGRPKSPEHRRKISEAQKGRVFTVEHREKISAAMKMRGVKCL